MTMFRFGCGHVKLDPEIHEASWGARLIYAEIVDTKIGGGTSVVWDRQTPDGEPDKVSLLFPVIDRAIDEFRKVKWQLPSDSRGRLCWREGRSLVVMSPQGSYGYLYVTAVLEYEHYEGCTTLAQFEEQPDEHPKLGNWPPEVVEAREAKEREADKHRLEWALREYKWALDEVRYARTPRAKTIRQKKADELGLEVERLRKVVGYPEEEVVTP